MQRSKLPGSSGCGPGRSERRSSSTRPHVRTGPATHACARLAEWWVITRCGTHGLYAGKTVDNVEELVVITLRGSAHGFGALRRRRVLGLASNEGDAGRIIRELRTLRREFATDIQSGYLRSLEGSRVTTSTNYYPRTAFTSRGPWWAPSRRAHLSPRSLCHSRLASPPGLSGVGLRQHLRSC